MSLLEDVLNIMQNPDPSERYLDGEAKRVINKALDAAFNSAKNMAEPDGKGNTYLTINELEEVFEALKEGKECT